MASRVISSKFFKLSMTIGVTPHTTANWRAVVMFGVRAKIGKPPARCWEARRVVEPESVNVTITLAVSKLVATMPAPVVMAPSLVESFLRSNKERPLR